MDAIHLSNRNVNAYPESRTHFTLTEEDITDDGDAPSPLLRVNPSGIFDVY